MAKTIEEMAREYAKVKVGDYDYLGNEYEAYLDGNEDAVKYILSLPLSNRLTDSERERIRAEYDRYMEQFCQTRDVMAKEFAMGQLNAYESIFGEEFFNETK